MVTRFLIGYWKRGRLVWQLLLFLCIISPLYLWMQLKTVDGEGPLGLSEERQVRNEPLVKDGPLFNGESEMEMIRPKGIFKNNSINELVKTTFRKTIIKSNDTQVSSTRKQKRTSIRFDNVEAMDLGCYSDVVHMDKRTLRDSFSSDVKRMTISRCVKQCSNKRFRYAGLEYRSECYCGNEVFNAKTDEASCDLKCSGDESQVCGGPNAVSIYEIMASERQPQRKQFSRDNSKSGYKSLTQSPGLADDFMICMVRPVEETFLRNGQMFEDSGMTIQKCKDYCYRKELPIAALARGNECHCGHLTEKVNLRDGKVETRLCDTACPGKSDQFCGGQDKISIYKTSIKDTSCDIIEMRPPNTMPLVSLASFPGSGNTWVRYLIERATGIYTGSYYNDGELSKKGFLGEREHYKKGTTVVIKTHRFDEDHIREFDAGIVVIRNPYDAMVSEHNRKFGGHTGHANPSQYKQGTEWTDFVLGKSRTWTNTALNWLLYQPNVHVVHYEHLKADIYGELKKIVQFLKLPVNENRLLCVASDPVGKFKRPPAPKNKQLEFDPFTEDMREMVSLYIKSVAMALEARNQEPLPDQYNPKFTFQSHD
ncbi:sialate:O-sulfotransferase 2-like [Antedon mediterranea]|uniref:sialate:O-sulfotransferase 2-like n=1 Tax=Antedon mediterranea TaxID=105859 RepID=UPI003AF8E4F8